MKKNGATKFTGELAENDLAEGFSHLLGISLDAVKFWPPFYFSSIFGKPFQWIPLHRYSEYTLLNLWRFPRALKYLTNTLIPALPVNPPPLTPPFLQSLFFRPTYILHRPDHNGDATTFPDESWFFINGIMTNDAVAQLNAAYLSDLFHRPITIIQNTTQSLFIDLTECAFGKEWKKSWRDIKEATSKTFPPIYESLKNKHKKKVVVLAHSQGTIIMSGVLEMLKEITLTSRPNLKTISGAAPQASSKSEEETEEAAFTFKPVIPAEAEFVFPYEGYLEPQDFEPLTLAELAKLEIYAFANCSNKMTFLRPGDQEKLPIPWIENYANEFDLVARLGMLAPESEKMNIRIDGPKYVKPGGWGHMLNEHYLKGIEQSQRIRLKKGGQGDHPAAPFIQSTPDPKIQPISPRLFGYINGGSPV